MKCDAFWGLDGPPNKYMIEFSKEEVEMIVKRQGLFFNACVGSDVVHKLIAEYEKHNEVDKTGVYDDWEEIDK